MTCSKPGWFWVAWLVSLTELGCGTGGQTGEETQEPCDESSTIIATDAASPLGFSPRDMLDLIGDVSTATLRWQQTPDLIYGPENGETSLTFTLRRAIEARFIESKSRTGQELAMPICQNRIEVTVDASVSTAGGALDESFEAGLVAATRDEAWLSHSFPPAALKGRFFIDSASLGSRKYTGLTLEPHWSAQGFGGLLAVGVEQTSSAGGDGSVSFTSMPIACFGKASNLGAACSGI